MEDKSVLDKAREKAKQKLGFYSHFVVFILVNLLLFFIDVIVNKGKIWFFWVLIGWGIGIISHYVRVFVIGDRFLDKLTQKEIERYKAKQ